MITDNKINANFLSYINKLKKYNCYSDSMIDALGDKLRDCPFSVSEASGGAYKGGCLDIVLNSLCTNAYRINETAFGGETQSRLRVNLQMLMRVLLLQHISKCELYTQETEQWRINKGYLFTFNDSLPSKLKLGERSAYLCQKYGIQLNEEEYEAIVSIDKIGEETKYDAFVSPLCAMTKAANLFTGVETRVKYTLNQKKETKEL